MGKTFIEKILRSTDVAKIYLILRPKKGVEPKKRMLQIFEDPVRFSIRHQLIFIFISYPAV